MSYQQEYIDRIIEGVEKGKLIWDGEKLVTQEEWDMQEREESIQLKMKEGEK